MGEPSTAPVLQYSEAPVIGGRLCLALVASGKWANAALACRGLRLADAARRERSGLRWHRRRRRQQRRAARGVCSQRRRSYTVYPHRPACAPQPCSCSLTLGSGRTSAPAPYRLIVSFLHVVTCAPCQSACCGRALLPPHWSSGRLCYCFSHPPLIIFCSCFSCLDAARSHSPHAMPSHSDLAHLAVWLKTVLANGVTAAAFQATDSRKRQ